jgi:2-keto-4-pentenoate hydratase
MIAPVAHSDLHRAAARSIWEAWTSEHPLPGIRQDARPADIEAGYAIQRELDELAGTPAGWKIAATSKAGQDHIGAPGPVVGRLYEFQRRRSGSTLSAKAMRMRSAEPEFAFIFGESVSGGAGRLSSDEVLGAVASLVLAIEVPDSRFVDFQTVGIASLVADAMCGGHFLLGPQPGDWRRLDLAAQEVRVLVGGEERSVGRGANVMGDPREALAWMANEVTGHGWSLHAGEVVLTGAAAPPVPIAPGDAVLAEFEGLGNVEVAFS